MHINFVPDTFSINPAEQLILPMPAESVLYPAKRIRNLFSSLWQKLPVLEGSSLWSMAYEEYGDCEKWRVIAKANGLLNPLQIYPGQVLKIPALQ